MNPITIFPRTSPRPAPAEDRQHRYEALVEAYSADLYRYAYWLGVDRGSVEDLVQETFLRAWRAFDSLRDFAAAKSWLFTIFRRENARRFARYRPEESDVDVDELPAHEAAHDANAQTIALRRAVALLPATYREPLLLQVLGGYRCHEIAELLGLRPSAVMTRLFRARDKLRVALDDGNERHMAGERDS